MMMKAGGGRSGGVGSHHGTTTASSTSTNRTWAAKQKATQLVRMASAELVRAASSASNILRFSSHRAIKDDQRVSVVRVAHLLPSFPLPSPTNEYDSLLTSMTRYPHLCDSQRSVHKVGWVQAASQWKTLMQVADEIGSNNTDAFLSVCGILDDVGILYHHLDRNSSGKREIFS